MKYKIIQAVNYPLIPMMKADYDKLNAKRIVINCKSEADLIRECGDADALIVTGMTPLKKEVIKLLERCRIIAVIGIGYQVDIEAATQKGICVVNVPDYCLDEVSDHAMALILACTRKINQLTAAVKKGLWDSSARVLIREGIWPGMAKLRGATLGLVGFGKIARHMVPKAQGFGMNIVAYTPHPDPDVAKKSDVTLCGLNDLIEVSDYISLHCPLVQANYHLFNESRLAKMKPTAFLINTARGPLIDEKALYEALVNGNLAGAGLDVLEQEDPPDPENPLLSLPQVIVTAHSAHYSETAMDILKQRPDQAIYELLRGKWPKGMINGEVKAAYEKKWGCMSSPLEI